MADKDLWTTFAKTGNVVDYLNYKGIHMDSNVSSVGECAVESDDNSDGNDIVRDTYR